MDINEVIMEDSLFKRTHTRTPYFKESIVLLSNVLMGSWWYCSGFAPGNVKLFSPRETKCEQSCSVSLVSAAAVGCSGWMKEGGSHLFSTWLSGGVGHVSIEFRKSLNENGRFEELHSVNGCLYSTFCPFFRLGERHVSSAFSYVVQWTVIFSFSY